jgi:hypothetical protein
MPPLRVLRSAGGTYDQDNFTLVNHQGRSGSRRRLWGGDRHRMLRRRAGRDRPTMKPNANSDAHKERDSEDEASDDERNGSGGTGIHRRQAYHDHNDNEHPHDRATQQQVVDYSASLHLHSALQDFFRLSCFN